MGLRIREGDPFPDLELVLHDGSRARISDFKGKILVVYFYPRAFTPGCTRETRKFAEIYEEFKRLGAEVIGVSLDPVDVNSRFALKNKVGFKLASDMEGSACKILGILGGLGPLRYAKRVTFIVGPDGRVARIIKGVKAEEHALRALEEVKRLLND
ncbi:MAG: peroxiredoxin [Desulfurococcales archaeon]|nr:peroxiredoxin [Desulfurococcales archaeon]